MKLRYILLCLVLLSITPTWAIAAGPQINGYHIGSTTVSQTYNYHTSLLDENLLPAKVRKSRIVPIEYQIDLDYVFVWRISVLAGEPVVNAWVAFKPTSITTNNSELWSWMFQKKSDLLKKVRLDEFYMKVSYYTHIPDERAHDHGEDMIIDAGCPLKPYFGHTSTELVKDVDLFNKYASFNAPISPEWEELFIGVDSKPRAIQLFKDYVAFYKHASMNSFDTEISKITLDTESINNLIFEYLQGLEKEIAAKQNKQSSGSDKAKKAPVSKQAADLDAALAETETGADTSEDLLSEDTASGSESFEDMLDETEKIKLSVHDIPRTTSANVITVSGRVENVSSIDTSEVVFRINGLEQPVYLQQDGSFSNKVVLFNGANRIDIDYTSGAKEEHQSFVVNSTTPPVKARFTLVWDSTDSDMDLHVHGPGGDHCSYNNKTTRNMRLDVDNTTHYGPENISVKLSRHPGTYKAVVKHYGGHSGNVTLYVYLDNRLVATEHHYLSRKRSWQAYTLHID